MSDILMLKEAAASQAISLVLFSKDQAGIDVQYTTFTNNRPKDYSNTIYVWEGGPDVPWQRIDSFVGESVIEGNTYTGIQRVNFPYDVGKDYVVGYAVASTPGATCSALYLPKDNQETTSENLTVGFSAIGPGAVKVNYRCLPQYNPVAFKNWVGIYNGPRADYDGKPLDAANVPFPNTNGSATIPIQLQIGATYTVGYYMVPLDKGKISLAAQVTFNT
ncbi:hypothetical protein DFR52_103816 [Hoeflea marina]|uniref:Uncharacterized protein n=1 Tax=Hoeflea marina TaxID=274592 RepID=A0A317PLD5_9HYPH|nr:hypothetical protein [Hoeflea marina]PWW00608.1 hypothetical protein DFR52_103816 [Hoeflea marina]